MRLIDADLLIEKIKDNGLFCVVDEQDKAEFILCLEITEIAYDIDKVIEQLEGKLCSEEDEKADMDCHMRNTHFREAIEIVKSGGIKMDGTEKLLPCPFCGGEMHIIKKECLTNGFISYGLYHGEFNHSTCVLAGQMLDTVFETEKSAIKKWNKRI